MAFKQVTRTVCVAARRGGLIIKTVVAAALLASLGVGGLAKADVGSCIPIVYEPPTVTINQSGVYCLEGPIGANLDSRPVIDIRASNVVLDLNGYRIGNLAAGPQTLAEAVVANGRKNITVRNGIIRGFATAVQITAGSTGADDSSGHIVENLTIERSRIRGIDLRGTESTVRNNRIYLTGDPDNTSGRPRAGIAVAGRNNSIIGNEIYNTHEPPPNLGGRGILLEAADSGFVSGNRIANSGPIILKTAGVEVGIGSNAIVSNNEIAGMDSGILYAGPLSDGIYAGNLIDNVRVGVLGGTDGGGNAVRLAP